ncbi:MAG: CDP-diacylglycerol--glycerol-3-phosphate 3-phosphatidyltransferase [Clostridia bacterium]|jgi:CDP-diacylglycerol--glycerol-3-phosphate 3-phosphatidyltransferase|nr:CDP-diacylglycerol--glycerol-3-phosphate 3-phosphatidyltransferase [Clostridiaceae bacterium]HJJ13372.1 CDP-diacylglycerol--glycerol-3-phosphate 3-phosphatidyltransferase [Clostridiaceae bacterium]
MNLANKLTIFRIILVPIMVIIPFLGINGEVFNVPLTWIIIDFIFILASITDKLDGYIARSRNQITTFGKFLDPIADKILVLAAMIMLVESNRLPAWIPIIVLFREFIVSGYRLVAVEKGGKVIAASIWGKLKTVTQMLALVLAIIDVNPFFESFKGSLSGTSLIINGASTILMIISVFATIFSGVNYITAGKDLFKE